MECSAHSDSDVVRMIKFNSHQCDSDRSGADVKKPPKDSGLGLVKDALQAFEKRHQSQTELKVHELELAQARDRREAEAEARWLEFIRSWGMQAEALEAVRRMKQFIKLAFAEEGTETGRVLVAEESLQFD